MAIVESKILLNETSKNSCLFATYTIEKKELFPEIKALIKEIEISFSPNPEKTFTYKLEFEKRKNSSRFYLGKTNEGSMLYINIAPDNIWTILDNKLKTTLEATIYFELLEKKQKKLLFFPFILKSEKGFVVEKRIHNIFYKNPSLVWMETASKIEKIIKEK